MYHFLLKCLLFLVGLSVPTTDLVSYQVGFVVLTPSKVTTALLLLLTLLGFMLTGRPMPRNGKNVGVLALAVAIGISAVASYIQGMSPGSILALLQTWVMLIAFYFLVSYTVADRKLLDFLLAGIVVGAAFSIGAGLLGLGRVSEGVRTRISGFGGNANYAAFGLVMALPLAAFFAFSARTFFRRVFAMGCTAVILVGTMATLSRSALLSTAVMWGYWILRTGRVDSLRYLVPALALGIGVLFFVPDTVVDRIQTLSSSQRSHDGSIQSRVSQNRWALYALAHQPVAGVGLGRFGPYAHRFDSNIQLDQTIHNAYLQVAAEQGLMGLLPFLAILALTWRDLSRASRRPLSPLLIRDPVYANFRQHALFLQVSFVGSLVGTLFQPAITFRSFWVLLALSTAIYAIVRQRAMELRSQAAEPFAAPSEPRFSFDVERPAAEPGR